MSAIQRFMLSTVGRKVFSDARITKVSLVNETFRWIELQVDGFLGAVWEPASKMKIDTGHLTLRTYTPVSIDPEQGLVTMVAYLHGGGPGSAWAAAARPGDKTRVGGPRPSLFMNDHPAPTVFFGDETSIGAAATLQRHLGKTALSIIIEAVSPTETEAIAELLGLVNYQVVRRASDGSHILHLCRRLALALKSLDTPHLVLTGSADSIQAIRSNLGPVGELQLQQRTKAYWNKGKFGLD